MTARSADGAKKLARVYSSEAKAKRAARQAATLDLTLALGRPDFYPEQRATASSSKAEIDATTWLIAQVTHNLGEQGHGTRLILKSKSA